MRLAEISYGDVGVKHFHEKKLRGIIPRRVTPRWYAQSNQSGYFYNISPGVPGRHFRSGEDDPGNPFALSFLRKDKISLIHSRISKYDASQ